MAVTEWAIVERIAHSVTARFLVILEPVETRRSYFPGCRGVGMDEEFVVV